MAQSTLSQADRTTVLEMHNQYRREVGLSPLVWDEALASEAQKWANHLGNGPAYHSTTASGESLSGGLTVRDAIESMYAERVNYHGETFTEDKNFRNKVGHYTQMVWPATTKVGVGGFRSTDGGSSTSYVFRYDPPGNMRGQAAPSLNQATAGPAGVAADPFDDTERAAALDKADKPISKLVLRWGDVVDSIHAVHGEDMLPVHGGEGIPANTGNISEVPINPNDPIVEVSGFHGRWFGGNYIQQLTFKTKRTTYGPFGSKNFADTSVPFTMTVPEWHRVRAIFGSVAAANNKTAKCLSQLGLVLEPATALFPRSTKGISIVGGDNQTAQKPPDSMLAFSYPLQVRVVDDNLDPVVLTAVTFTALSADTQVFRMGDPVGRTVRLTATVKTNANGVATIHAIASAAGTVQIQATVDSGPQPRTVTFSLTATN